ncbi:hypothetical protein FRC04_008039 [Tulasnella sp. 424]|nr:hypothetical protein FRC04_008039 [Tulasnella sp. 424]KAG8974699.1 hypothetical protein FRC05_006859 [Tulasnella sp. 425]
MFTDPAAFILLALIAAGSATPHLNRRGAVQIPIAKRAPHSHTTKRHTPVFDLESAERQRARIIAKYNKPTRSAADEAVDARQLGGVRSGPEPELNARQAGSSGAEPLVDLFKGHDIAYYGTISIGTPPQQTTIDFDTASADLIIPLLSEDDFDQEFADGSSVSGKVATDTVTMAGLTVQNQGFAAATQESGRYNSLGVFAGIMGLAFPPLANTKKNPFFVNLVEQKSLASNLFSFYLARNGAEGSELCLGCINTSKFTGEMQWFPVDYQDTFGIAYYWSIATGGLTYNGTPLAGGGYTLLVDTGTTFVFVPSDNAEALYSQIPGSSPASELGQGYFKFPCNSTLSAVAFQFGSSDFAIHPSDFNVGPHPSDPSSCIGAVLSVPNGSRAVAGDAFLKNWYSVYDYDGMRVGFAQANH